MTPNGNYQHDFALDTLASWSLIPADLAESYGIEAYQNVPIETAGGTQMIPQATIMVAFHGMPPMPITFLLVPSSVLALGQDVIRRYQLLSQNVVIDY
jgi:hypothetical protein